MDHSGIKIPFFAFFAHDSGKRCEEAPKHMLWAMGITAFLCIAIGVYPQALYSILPYPVDYAPYTTAHVITQLQLLMFSALAFVFLFKTGLYPPEVRSHNLDTDWFYRVGAASVIAPISKGIGGATQSLFAGLSATWQQSIAALDKVMGPRAWLSRSVDSTGMVALTMGSLLIFLLLYLV